MVMNLLTFDTLPTNSDGYANHHLSNLNKLPTPETVQLYSSVQEVLTI